MSLVSHQLFEKCGQDVIQRLVTDGGVELLKGFGCSLPDFFQGVAESLSHSGNQGLREDEHLQNHQDKSVSMDYVLKRHLLRCADGAASE